MTGMDGQSAHRAWTLGAAAAVVASFAVAFLALFSSPPADAATASVRAFAPRYALVPVTIAPSAAAPKALEAAIGPTPHGPYTKVADECAACHRTHTGKNNNLLKSPSPQSNLCFSCHDGTGASTDVKGQFTDPAVPQNDNTNRLYYRHDTIGTTAHTSAGVLRATPWVTTCSWIASPVRLMQPDRATDTPSAPSATSASTPRRSGPGRRRSPAPAW